MEMQGCYDIMEHEIDSMEDRLCCCARTVPIEEEGGLEYKSSNAFVIAPAAPSLSTPSPPSVPQENASPIPVPPPLPSSSSDVENITPPVADCPATPLPVRCPLKTLRLAPYTHRRCYPHTIATGIVVDGFRYHRVEDIPQRRGDRLEGSLELSKSLRHCSSEDPVSSGGSVAQRLGLSSPGAPDSWFKPDEWVRAVDRAESGGWGSAIGFVTDRAEQQDGGKQRERSASRGVRSSVEV